MTSGSSPDRRLSLAGWESKLPLAELVAVRPAVVPRSPSLCVEEEDEEAGGVGHPWTASRVEEEV